MLRLSREARLTRHVIPVCTPPASENLRIGHVCKVLGWGKIRSDDLDGTQALHEADMPLKSRRLCRLKFHEYDITERMLCAGNLRRSVDTCSGDSGGPLLCRDELDSENVTAPRPWMLAGITSFGETCERRGKLGVYTRVSRYLNWIRDVMDSYP